VGDAFGVASRLDDNVAKGSSDGANDRLENWTGESLTQRSAGKEVAVDRRDFFAKQQTGAPEPPGTGRQWDSCGASLSG
jgi:hypothetical protein